MGLKCRCSGMARCFAVTPVTAPEHHRKSQPALASSQMAATGNTLTATRIW